MVAQNKGEVTMAQYFTGYSGTGHRPGGGMGSNKVVERSAPKQEPRAHAVSVEAVSRYGTAQGNHATDSGGRILPGGGRSLYAGPGYQGGPVGPRPTAEGPGGGREIQHCGSQGQHGPVAGTPFQASHKGWEPVR
jgi:hypothetical protein